MPRLDHHEAVRMLAEGASPVDPALAVGSLGNDPQTQPSDLLPALDYPGYPAEQAAILLHRLTATPWLADGRPNTSRLFWQWRLQPDVDRLVAQTPARKRNSLLKRFEGLLQELREHAVQDRGQAR